MKKHCSLLLGVIAAFSLLFVSCGSEEPESPICEIVVESDGNGKVAITNNTGMAVTILKGNSLEVVATPDEGYEFVGWFANGSTTPVSTEAAYTFVVSRSIVLVAKFRFPFVATGKVDGYDYVDLGLPSGLKWATHNVGATEIYDKGNYYSWGESIEKPAYNKTYYQLTDDEGNINKYYAGDGKTVLEPEDDVAAEKWGGSWRLPTKEELQELVDNCSFLSMKVNGVLGMRIKGPNNNCIFLPAASYRSSPYSTILAGYMCYWSSSLSDASHLNAYCFDTYIGTVNKDYTMNVTSVSRYLGYSVRPVAE